MFVPIIKPTLKNANFGPNIFVKTNETIINKTKIIDVKTIYIHTSAECVGAHAEYIRDGLNYKQWLQNLKYCLERGIDVHIMMTLNALCFASFSQ